MKILCIIPARYNSTRFPGKPLIDINGKTMIERVWGQSKKSNLISESVVATDDERILNHVIKFGGKAVLTSSSHQSGTDRCYEALSKSDINFDAVVNIQGDEPFIDENYIDKVCQLLIDGASIATLAHPILDIEEVNNPNKVKVVVSKTKKALYFSRSVLPFDRNNISPNYLGHIGIYGYSKSTLNSITKLPTSSLELSESLEQLRWLENDFSIYVDTVNEATQGIDTPEDLEKLLKSLNN